MNHAVAVSRSAHPPLDSAMEEGGAVELRPGRADLNERLDRFVADALPDLSRSYVQTLIDGGNVLVDGRRRKAKFKMTPGQVVSVRIPPTEAADLVPEAIPLDVRYEDDDVIVLEKPAGMVVHPAPGHTRGTLANAILHHAPDTSLAGSNRPGIVHRLDKDTSGLMVVAKSDRARASLVEQWGTRSVGKRYLALVSGIVEADRGTIDAPIARDPGDRQRMAVERGGREAITHFTVVRRYDDCALLDVEIETGRTHQIRVHLAFIGHPVVGDEIYATKAARTRREVPTVPRQFLHASRLEFALPGGERVTFVSALPPDLKAVLDQLEPVERPRAPSVSRGIR